MSLINTVTATINVNGGPYGVAVSPTGPEAGDVYITNSLVDTVTAVS